MSVIATRDQIPQIVRGPAGPASRAPAVGAGLTGRDLLRILRRRKWLVIFFTAGFFEYNFGDSEVALFFLLIITLPFAAGEAGERP